MDGFFSRWRRFYFLYRKGGDLMLVSLLHSLDDAVWITNLRRKSRHRP